jgi:cbb3-type cytochrome oxidase subunit 3
MIDGRGVLYLAVTAGLFFLFAAIVAHVCSRRRRERFEEAKYRMLADD